MGGGLPGIGGSIPGIGSGTCSGGSCSAGGGLSIPGVGGGASGSGSIGIPGIGGGSCPGGVCPLSGGGGVNLGSGGATCANGTCSLSRAAVRDCANGTCSIGSGGGAAAPVGAGGSQAPAIGGECASGTCPSQVGKAFNTLGLKGITSPMFPVRDSYGEGYVNTAFEIEGVVNGTVANMLDKKSFHPLNIDEDMIQWLFDKDMPHKCMKIGKREAQEYGSKATYFDKGDEIKEFQTWRRFKVCGGNIARKKDYKPVVGGPEIDF